MVSLTVVLAFSLATQAAGQSTQPAGSFNPKPGPQRVAFTTDDPVPVELVATYLSPRTDNRNRRCPMVILLHAEGQTRASFDALLPLMQRSNLAVLAVDLRGHGESIEPAVLKLKSQADRGEPKLFRDMLHDVGAAYRWLARRPEIDSARFVLVGAGLGADVALEYAVRDKSVDGVVMLSPKLNEAGCDPVASARKYAARPLLLLAAPADRAGVDVIGPLVPDSVVKIVSPRSSAGSPDAGSLYGTRMFGNVANIEPTIVEFVVKAAGQPSTTPVVASLKGSTFYELSSRQADRLAADNVRHFSSAAECNPAGIVHRNSGTSESVATIG